MTLWFTSLRKRRAVAAPNSRVSSVSITRAAADVVRAACHTLCIQPRHRSARAAAHLEPGLRATPITTIGQCSCVATETPEGFWMTVSGNHILSLIIKLYNMDTDLLGTYYPQTLLP